MEKKNIELIFITIIEVLMRNGVLMGSS